MSPHEKLVTLQLLNGFVAAAYILLSVSFAAVWTKIAAAFRQSQGPSPRSPKLLRLALHASFIGSALFLFGCGIHHAHLALVMIPQSEIFGPRSLWVVHFWDEASAMALQVAGAPVMLIAGLYTARSVRLSAAE